MDPHVYQCRSNHFILKLTSKTKNDNSYIHHQRSIYPVIYCKQLSKICFLCLLGHQFVNFLKYSLNTLSWSSCSSLTGCRVNTSVSFFILNIHCQTSWPFRPFTVGIYKPTASNHLAKTFLPTSTFLEVVIIFLLVLWRNLHSYIYFKERR